MTGGVVAGGYEQAKVRVANTMIASVLPAGVVWNGSRPDESRRAALVARGNSVSRIRAGKRAITRP